jgi:uncharacterized protein YjiS (DUF1127 family)
MVGSVAILAARRRNPLRSGRSLGEGLKAAWRAYWQRRVWRAAAEVLRRLDDRALRDIGISRAEVDCVVLSDTRHCGCR